MKKKLAKVVIPKSITKKQIITVLKKEPLFPGDWIHPDIQIGKSCAVCAVGSVIRKVINDSKTVEHGNLVDSIANEMTGMNCSGFDFRNYLTNYKTEIKAFKAIIAKDGYWSALSAYFEHKSEYLRYLMNSVVDDEVTVDTKSKIEKFLLKECREAVVPDLIKMVEKCFPDKIDLPVDFIKEEIKESQKVFRALNR